MKLRVLMLEDDSNDVELTRTKWLPDMEVIAVATPDAFKQQLFGDSFDAILVDHNTPGLYADAAIAYVRKVSPDTPVILLSGTIGESEAIGIMRRGAADCVSKNAPDRLPDAIRGAIERYQALAKLRHQQRIEAIGAVASGVAHDLNNVLAPIQAVLSNIRAGIPGFNDPKYLDMALQECQRGAELIQQILSFARGRSGEPMSITSPVDLIQRLINLVRHTFPTRINISNVIAGAVPMIFCNATQIMQVLLNLCTNARDAMPHGGELIIRVDQQIVNNYHAYGIRDPINGRFVRFRVTDTGVGMLPDVLAKLFTPFFTSKPAGAGTGQGLSVSLRIVLNHGGFINVETAPNRGSTFSVFLPAHHGPTRPTTEEILPPPATGKGETVLVCDDEESIVSIFAALLEVSGYKVLSAHNGAEAMQVLRSQYIDVVLTDRAMPIVSGDELLETVRVDYPHVKVVMMTGLEEGSGELEPDAVLKKPFCQRQLLDTIREVLSAD